MMKRLLAFVLCLCTALPFIAMGVSAIPYSPSGNALKDFGQGHNYFYQTNGKTPIMDGYVTEADGYGEPAVTFGFRYVTTVTRAVMDENNQPLKEYKLRDDGDYYVYPDENTSEEVWQSITRIEVTNPHAYIDTYWDEYTAWSAARTFYYYNPILKAMTAAPKFPQEQWQNWPAQDSNGNFYLTDVVELEGETVDWETNYKDYFTLGGTNTYKQVGGDKAPKWEPGKYYYGEKIYIKRFYQSQASNAKAIADYVDLRNHHVFLPEEVNIYARYDDEFFYQAVEVREPAHVTSQYFWDNRFGATMSNSVASVNFSTGIKYYIRRDADMVDTAKQSASAGSAIRSYANVYSSLKTASLTYIIAKYGKEGVTQTEQIWRVQKVGEDYNITHSDYVRPTAPANDPDWVDPKDDPLQSDKYGTTVYEQRQKWTLINNMYNGEGSPVPEMFMACQYISLENTLGDSAHTLRFYTPRETPYLLGSIGRKSQGNYDAKDYVIRFPSTAGVTTKGTYRFFWANITSSFAPWNDIHTTDYFDQASQKSFGATEINPIWFPAGKEVSSAYDQPQLYGTQIRYDSTEVQKMRFFISLPEGTEEDPTKPIAEVGAIVAPTEVARRTQLRLGMTSIRYIAEENPTLYGIVNGQWMNLCEDPNTYFESSKTPNYADSYMAWDTVGGKPSGIYTVYTLKADVENPYRSSVSVGEDFCNLYSVVLGGHNDEGLYADYDDFFTFYTVRPYVKYADGTVVYGEHEYRSIYYTACYMIQDILDSYNSTAGITDSTKMYNMDQMEMLTWADAEGNTISDADGNPIYIPRPYHTTTAHSPYQAGAEYSIYLPERRAEVFRWYAVRLLSQSNGNTPLRNDEYDTFSDETKELVQNYVGMLENIWSIIVNCENTVYYTVNY